MNSEIKGFAREHEVRKICSRVQLEIIVLHMELFYFCDQRENFILKPRIKKYISVNIQNTSVSMYPIYSYLLLYKCL